jgi:cytochrome oxidase Cu insertion factor (SCO1/SenC/PrrC family)
MKRASKCHVINCKLTPELIVLWPGFTFYPKVCKVHAEQAEQLAAELGIRVRIEVIHADGKSRKSRRHSKDTDEEIQKPKSGGGSRYCH